MAETNGSRGRLQSWLTRHQLWVALPLALLVGLLVGGTAFGGGPSGDGSTAGAHGEGHDHGEAPTVWTCSMHPQIRMPEQGKCPICGMDLIRAGSSDGQTGPGPGEVVLSERAKTLARIETTPVRRAAAATELRLLGKLEIDETKVRTVTPWVDGRIDRLLVSALGETIKRGQVVASMYSPEVYAAQIDLAQAKRQLERLSGALPIARTGAQAALESAETRLRLLGMSKGAVRKMASAESPARNVAIVSRYGGTVIEQLVHEGAYVEAGTPLYKVADLSTIWAQLDAYESDLSRLTEGQLVRLYLSSLPDESFEGKVAFVDPVVDPRTRTAQVRVEIPNEDGRLRPGMFADAVVKSADRADADPPLVVPRSAPLFTGKRSVVYVAVTGADKPTYQARQVALGPLAGGVYPVLAGLKEGELVVARGAFALDSDLQIRGGISMMSHDDDLARQAKSPVRVDDAFMEGLGHLLPPYLEIQRALSKDELGNAQQAFASLVEGAESFRPRAPEPAVEVWEALRAPLLAAARGGVQAKELGELRRSFDSASSAMIEALQRFGNPLAEPLRLAFCPMAFDDRGALWVQRAEQIENPYFGAEMYRCGEIRETAAPAAHLGPHADELEAPKPAAGAAHGGHDHG
jgi:Cu(I)/Ag(I) efflux system membrane fusion protein